MKQRGGLCAGEASEPRFSDHAAQAGENRAVPRFGAAHSKAGIEPRTNVAVSTAGESLVSSSDEVAKKTEGV